MNNVVRYSIVKLKYLRLRWILFLKVRKIYRNVQSNHYHGHRLSSDVIHQNVDYLKSFGLKNASKKWQIIYYSVSAIPSNLYIPEDIYYIHIEPKLNNYALCKAYADKNGYEKLMPDYRNLFPVALLRRMNNTFYDREYNPVVLTRDLFREKFMKCKYVIIKNSLDTGGGRGITLFQISENQDESWNSLKAFLQTYTGDFIAQEYIQQNEFFRRFNETSVNTVRVFTYRSVVTNRVKCIHAVLRIGKKGSIVDNQAAGGVACGLDLSTGKLNDFVSDKYANRYASFNQIDFKEVRHVPKMEQIRNLAEQIAMNFLYHRLLSFDFSINSEGEIKLIEINTKNHEINFYQFNNGPLFGTYTDEILEYCKQNKCLHGTDITLLR